MLCVIKASVCLAFGLEATMSSEDMDSKNSIDAN